jgi:hypothetical protein
VARKDRSTRRLFPKGGQFEFFEKSYAQELAEQKVTGVECLGLHFPDEDTRRAHFAALLTEKLKDPAFRKFEGFPLGSDEDILRLSDPPYYTACPNPFLEEFVRVYGRPYDPKEPYHREPFAVDTSVGKSDPLYKAHGYHTKVPHLAIVPSILHYTKPGDIVLDGFSGTGMTGVAAQWCGTAPKEFRDEVEAQWRAEGRTRPEWGARRAVLNDLSPAATFIAAGYNLPFDVRAFAEAAQQILDALESEIGWMYETLHTDGKTKGKIEYTVWSEVFSCPECSGQVVFFREAFDLKSKTVRDTFACPNCRAKVSKKQLDRLFESRHDSALSQSVRHPRRVPVLIAYRVGNRVHEKEPDHADIALLSKVSHEPLPSQVPARRMLDMPKEVEVWGDKYRAGTASFSHVHHLFLPRQAAAMGRLWRLARAEKSPDLRRTLLFFAEQAILGLSVLARYVPSHYSQVNQYLGGVYYVPSQIAECSPWYILDGKLGRLRSAMARKHPGLVRAALSTGSCSHIPCADESVDYVFTDPPFGANFAYAELNFVVEAFHGVVTAMAAEAIVSPAQEKSTETYRELMRTCFQEYYRLLKPGRWMTVVFSNSSNAVWRAIQEALGAAGFVVADVRTLDKLQGSFNQIAGVTVDKDLVISAYKPLAKRGAENGVTQVGEPSAWEFVTEHLSHVPVFVGKGEEAEVLSERTAQVLLDRMISFHVQRGLGVPVDAASFYSGLERRFPKRDAMYFLPHQAAEYDRRRGSVKVLRQMVLTITDEASALQWVRQQLHEKPRSFQDLQPQFTKEIKNWASYEATVELRDILESNFLCYDGKGPVPNRIHAYLSTDFKNLRSLAKDHKDLVEKAKNRWYVPDPGKEGDLVRLREKALLEEFARYQGSKGRLKQFRTEAIRAGFKAAYDARNYKAIVEVAARIPESVLQEDEKLLMYFDVASTRLGE